MNSRSPGSYLAEVLNWPIGLVWAVYKKGVLTPQAPQTASQSTPIGASGCSELFGLLSASMRLRGELTMISPAAMRRASFALPMATMMAFANSDITSAEVFDRFSPLDLTVGSTDAWRMSMDAEGYHMSFRRRTGPPLRLGQAADPQPPPRHLHAGSTHLAPHALLLHVRLRPTWAAITLHATTIPIPRRRV